MNQFDHMGSALIAASNGHQQIGQAIMRAVRQRLRSLHRWYHA